MTTEYWVETKNKLLTNAVALVVVPTMPLAHGLKYWTEEDNRRLGNVFLLALVHPWGWTLLEQSFGRCLLGITQIVLVLSLPIITYRWINRRLHRPLLAALVAAVGYFVACSLTNGLIFLYLLRW